MKHYEVKYFDKTLKSVVHLDGVQQPGDMSICGCDLMGDGTLGWYAAVETMKPINCVTCCRIITACKEVKSTEYKKSFKK